MNKTILYLGDTSLKTAASYLSGVMAHWNIDFDYISSDEKIDDLILSKDYKAVIISDYPSSNFNANQLDTLKNKIANGMGLLMIGGWDSFVGSGGNYQNTCLHEVLPVVMKNTDDRKNNYFPCVVSKTADHFILNNIPLDSDLPCIGGFNEFVAKNNAQTILSINMFFAMPNKQHNITFEKRGTAPLLVVGSYKKGNIACFASDVAPHWIGGLVDWGDKSIKAKASGSTAIEVGNHYAILFKNLIEWVC